MMVERISPDNGHHNPAPRLLPLLNYALLPSFHRAQQLKQHNKIPLSTVVVVGVLLEAEELPPTRNLPLSKNYEAYKNTRRQNCGKRHKLSISTSSWPRLFNVRFGPEMGPNLATKKQKATHTTWRRRESWDKSPLAAGRRACWGEGKMTQRPVSPFPSSRSNHIDCDANVSITIRSEAEAQRANFIYNAVQGTLSSIC